MSLDFYLVKKEDVHIYSTNITHNLGKMAKEAGIYEVLWGPEEIGCKYAKDIIPILKKGLDKLKSNPDEFKKYNPENGWGNYESLVKFATNVLTECQNNKNLRIKVDR